METLNCVSLLIWAYDGAVEGYYQNHIRKRDMSQHDILFYSCKQYLRSICQCRRCSSMVRFRDRSDRRRRNKRDTFLFRVQYNIAAFRPLNNVCFFFFNDRDATNWNILI